MPKEIAHFTMARMMLGRMGKAPEGEDAGLFDLAVRQYPCLFLFGAVVPDINFYCMAGRDAQKIQALSSPFHRFDRRALEPVFGFLDRREAVQKRDLPALALGAGVVCHILADTLFHPLVYYYAGMDGVHAGATIRHRQFETAMDIYFWQAASEKMDADTRDPGILYPDEAETWKPHWIRRRMARAEISKKDLVLLLSDLFAAGPLGGPSAVRRALGWHMGIQYLFFARWMKVLMTGCRKAGRPLSGKATGLTYPFRRGVPLPFFSETIRFCDPCTGEAKEGRTMEMAREAADQALRVLGLAARGISRNSNLVPFLMDHAALPVIRPGLPPEKARIWNGQENIIPRIYRGYPPPF